MNRKSPLHAHLHIIVMTLTKFWKDTVRNVGGVAFTRNGQTEKMTPIYDRLWRRIKIVINWSNKYEVYWSDFNEIGRYFSESYKLENMSCMESLMFELWTQYNFNPFLQGDFRKRLRQKASVLIMKYFQLSAADLLEGVIAKEFNKMALNQSHECL